MDIKIAGGNVQAAAAISGVPESKDAKRIIAIQPYIQQISKEDRGVFAVLDQRDKKLKAQ